MAGLFSATDQAEFCFWDDAKPQMAGLFSVSEDRGTVALGKGNAPGDRLGRGRQTFDPSFHCKK